MNSSQKQEQRVFLNAKFKEVPNMGLILPPVSSPLKSLKRQKTLKRKKTMMSNFLQ